MDEMKVGNLYIRAKPWSVANREMFIFTSTAIIFGNFIVKILMQYLFKKKRKQILNRKISDQRPFHGFSNCHLLKSILK